MDTKARDIAGVIHDAFATFRTDFAAATHAAQARFATADWAACAPAATDRLRMYQQRVDATVLAVLALTGSYVAPGLWFRVKTSYAPLLAGRQDGEVGETFFNSVFRRITHGAYVRDDEMFVYGSAMPTAAPGATVPYRRHACAPGTVLSDLFAQLLTDTGLGVPWENLGRNARAIARALVTRLPHLAESAPLCVDLVASPFYRNKGAYLVGRLRYAHEDVPLALPVLNNEAGGVFVDALLAGEEQLSLVFSFTRAYFMVDTPCPSALVDFLQLLMPQKKRSEIYSAIGFPKHAKTEFYRGFLAHLQASDDQFVIAAGIKGMVMAVFTLPSYTTVFKIIKDEFAPQKNTTRAHVRAAYELVKNHDRVGRMADTQEFHHMVLPQHRFAPDLIDELRRVARSTVDVIADRVVVSHVYTERLMTPLNIYIHAAPDGEREHALNEYGLAIKQLAAANIFPGDMLLKNFGVTRHGRVVFYDYDEICYLTEVNFRRLPEPQTEEQVMAAEPWYSVAPADVFPEEFPRFLFAQPEVKRQFNSLHGELFDPDYWRGLQQAIRAGKVLDVFPYPKALRFDPERVTTGY